MAWFIAVVVWLLILCGVVYAQYRSNHPKQKKVKKEKPLEIDNTFYQVKTSLGQYLEPVNGMIVHGLKSGDHYLRLNGEWSDWYDYTAKRYTDKQFKFDNYVVAGVIDPTKVPYKWHANHLNGDCPECLKIKRKKEDDNAKWLVANEMFKTEKEFVLD